MLKLGILGDSSSDEYRADDNRGGQWPAYNWVEQLALTNRVDVGRYSTFNDIRRTGYQYNFSRSGITSGDLLASGAAQALAAERVELVVVSVGTNDLGAAYPSIYEGTLQGPALASFVASVSSNILTLANLVKNVSAVLVVTITDLNLIPAIPVMFPDPAKRARVSAAIEEINRRLRLSFAVVESSDFARAVFQAGVIPIGYVNVNPNLTGNEPTNGLLDGLHPGTAWSGKLANFYLGNVVKPLRDLEILSFMGMLPYKPGDTVKFNVNAKRSLTRSKIIDLRTFFTGTTLKIVGVDEDGSYLVQDQVNPWRIAAVSVDEIELA